MRIVLILTIFVLLIIILFALIYLPPRLKIITGYAAKSMCSCVFLANRVPESVVATDLNFSFVKYARAWIDPNEKAAYSTVFGLAKRKAVYREGFGCSLVFNSESPLLSIKFKVRQKSLDTENKPWPFGDEVSDTSFSEINYQQLNRAVENAFDKENERRKNTRVIIAVYKDQIVAEKYAPGFDIETPQLGWSMTKSLTNAMIGLMIKENLLKLDQEKLLEEWSNDQRGQVSIDHLLHMGSGLQWNEQYGDQSDATIMLYQKNDKSGYALEKPLGNDPGTTWVYSSGTSNILQKIIRNTLSDDMEYWSFPYENLFHKIGMHSATMEVDNTGTFIGSSYCYATPRDWARFGLLNLHDGVWNGTRILPEGWVKYSSTPFPPSNGEYGAHFWINVSGKYPTAPKDMIVCQGFHGQRIFIIPSMELVIVRMGVSEEGTFDFDRLLEEILSSFNH